MNNKQSATKSLIFFALITILSSALTLQDIHQKVLDSTMAGEAVFSGASTTAPVYVPAQGTALLWIESQHKKIVYI